jgi:hypothetical protein
VIPEETPEEEESSEKQRESLRRRMTDMNLLDLIDDLDEMLYGRKARMRAPPKTARPKREQRNLMLAELIPTPELKSTSSAWRAIKKRASADLREMLPKLSGPTADRELDIPAAISPQLSFLAPQKRRVIPGDDRR